MDSDSSNPGFGNGRSVKLSGIEYRRYDWQVETPVDSPGGFLNPKDVCNFVKSTPRSGNKDPTCIMCGANDVLIPSQNKKVCKNCDSSFWLWLKHQVVFKFCKGCKNFCFLAEFDDRPEGTKCTKCRQRSRDWYHSKRNGDENTSPSACGENISSRNPTPVSAMLIPDKKSSAFPFEATDSIINSQTESTQSLDRKAGAALVRKRSLSTFEDMDHDGLRSVNHRAYKKLVFSPAATSSSSNSDVYRTPASKMIALSTDESPNVSQAEKEAMAAATLSQIIPKFTTPHSRMNLFQTEANTGMSFLSTPSDTSGFGQKITPARSIVDASQLSMSSADTDSNRKCLTIRNDNNEDAEEALAAETFDRLISCHPSAGEQTPSLPPRHHQQTSNRRPPSLQLPELFPPLPHNSTRSSPTLHHSFGPDLNREIIAQRNRDSSLLASSSVQADKEPKTVERSGSRCDSRASHNSEHSNCSFATCSAGDDDESVFPALEKGAARHFTSHPPPVWSPKAMRPSNSPFRSLKDDVVDTKGKEQEKWQWDPNQNPLALLASLSSEKTGSK